ncbi:MAG: ABC transporter permease [Opitutales bacterium]
MSETSLRNPQTSAQSSLDKPRTVVDASRLTSIPWDELWRFRELFLFLAWRDFLVRYKQTAIGIFWAVLQPVLQMIVLTIVFGSVAGMEENEGQPYAIMVLAGILPWQFFAQSLNFGSLSLINNHPLVAKTYLPRLLLPASTIAVNFIDLAIALLLLLILMPLFGVWYSWTMLAILPLTLLATLLSLGCALFVSALNVKYRDFKYVLPFFIQIGLFATPVGWSSDRLLEQPEIVQWLFYLNPMTGVVDGFRWAVFGEGNIQWSAFGVSVVGTLLLAHFGLRFFRRSEAWFADVI